MAAPDAPALRGDDRDKISKAFERDAYGTRYSLTQYELSNRSICILEYCYSASTQDGTQVLPVHVPLKRLVALAVKLTSDHVT